MLTITAPDGHEISALYSKPTGSPKGTIIVLNEVFGLTNFMQDICDFWAQQGYRALAPAMFDRLGPNKIFAYSQSGIEDALQAKQQLMQMPNQDGLIGWDLQVYDIQATVDHIKQQHPGPIGVTGFCWGGTLCWLAASRIAGLDAVAAYYGTNIYAFIEEKPLCPFMLHAADKDEYLTLEQVTDLEAKYPNIPVYHYPAGHAFRCDKWVTFNAEASQQADERSVDFFAKHLK